MKIRWLGQAGYELKSQGVTILIDPYLSDMVEREEGLKRLLPAPISCDYVEADAILYTHAHMDHLDEDMIRKMKKGRTYFYGPNSGREILQRSGVDQEHMICLERGCSFQIGGIVFDAVFAKHTEDSLGYILHYNGSTFYFTGDSQLTEEVGCDGLRGMPLETDVIFVCINGKLGNMTAQEAVLLTKRVHASTGIPNHYGMFAENTEDPCKYEEGLHGSSCRAMRLEWNKDYLMEDLL